jgi:hypothetical protein
MSSVVAESVRADSFRTLSEHGVSVSAMPYAWTDTVSITGAVACQTRAAGTVAVPLIICSICARDSFRLLTKLPPFGCVARGQLTC